MSPQTAEAIWYQNSVAARVGRGVLAPAGWAYCAATALRNRLYDLGFLRSEEPLLPTLSIGNLTVGGTGKTPVAAWAARRLLESGGHPAIVLRGYGSDEPLVHARLNPRAVVVADANRVRAVANAAAMGADCAILDDAYQHRRIRRKEDWLLVAAERWEAEQRCLPAGPLRESVDAMSRATLVLVTRKSASLDQAREVAARIAVRWEAKPTAIAHLALLELVNARDGSSRALKELAGTDILAIAAIGAPDAFFAQLRAMDVLVDEATFRDHHAFSDEDIASLARRGASRGAVVCTLKDAVKLAPRWPRAAPTLWYVSQSVEVELGEAGLGASLTNILAARPSAPQTAGAAGPHSPAHGHRSSSADQ